MPDFFEALRLKEEAEQAARLAQATPRPSTDAYAAVINLDPGRADKYAQAALDGELERVRTAQEGTRNHTLNTAAFNLGQLVAAGELDAATVTRELTLAATMIGLPPSEITATINSGLNGSSDKPRVIPDPIELDTPNVTVLEDPPATQEEAIEQHRLRLIARELEQQRARREAKRILDAEEALKSFREPPSRFTLTDELAIPDLPVNYTIDQVLPAGGNVLLTAQYKTGKTTLVNNLARSLADQRLFLDKFDIANLDGRVALWNYEVDDNQYRRWLRDAGVGKTDNIAILNLRGYRMPLVVRYVEDWIVRWLEERQVKVWVVDPFARAFTGSGTSENDNTEVGAFLDTLDVIKNRAGVSDLILPTHTGRAEFEAGDERARGATRLDDWADVRWFLTKDADEVRYFRATGRDVEVAEEKLTFDEATRSLTFGGGNRAWERRKRVEDAVVRAIKDDPGISQAAIHRAVRDQLGKASQPDVDDAIAGAQRGHRIRIERGGKGVSNRHYSTEISPYGGVQDEL